MPYSLIIASFPSSNTIGFGCAVECETDGDESWRRCFHIAGIPSTAPSKIHTFRFSQRPSQSIGHGEILHLELAGCEISTLPKKPCSSRGSISYNVSHKTRADFSVIEKRRIDRVTHAICHNSIVFDQQAILFSKRFKHSLNLIRMPYVILIAEKNIVAGAMRNGIAKIGVNPLLWT